MNYNVAHFLISELVACSKAGMLRRFDLLLGGHETRPVDATAGSLPSSGTGLPLGAGVTSACIAPVETIVQCYTGQ